MACKPIFLSLSLLTGLALHADDAPQPDAALAPQVAPKLDSFRWGVQVGLAFPTTKTFKYFSDSGTGFVIGGQVTWDWQVDKRWRARIDYTAFPKVTVNSLAGPFSREDNTVSGVTGGIDYLYFWQGKHEGFYTTVGVALAHWTQSTSTTGDNSDTSLGLAAGAGWQFNRNFGLEARATWSRWQTNIVPTTTHNAGTLNLEGSYRF